MDDKFEKIKAILVEVDLMGLIKIGASCDEYNQEAMMIYESINRYDTDITIKHKLWDIFYSQFCDGGDLYQLEGDTLIRVGKALPYDKERAIRIIGDLFKYEAPAIKIKEVIGD